MKYKQSSVDFYAEKSLDLFNLFQQGSISINDFRARMSIIEIEAKAMHEKEIEDAELRGKEIIIIKHTEHEGGNK
jgi:hypothetical protein